MAGVELFRQVRRGSRAGVNRVAARGLGGPARARAGGTASAVR